ncbi:hypothetical protein [Shewanella sp. MBTL60-007]|uniref:hypothetical protein n=1 Tax=Shewanella sp. MBTL60-007 TaxID=2815911 RepID=UPI001BC6C07F|nr:hypothetical protein [Shewanella sp. MBTL60-007]GIU31288.1 hypothetical protein TUM3792_42890 [Shewanella sp. MBTL60-007]
MLEKGVSSQIQAPKIFNEAGFEICLAVDVFWELAENNSEMMRSVNAIDMQSMKAVHQLAIRNLQLFEYNDDVCELFFEYFELMGESRRAPEISDPDAIRQAIVLQRLAKFSPCITRMSDKLQKFILQNEYLQIAAALAFINSDTNRMLVDINQQTMDAVLAKIKYQQNERKIEEKLVALRAAKVTLQTLMKRPYSKAEFKMLHNNTENRRGRPNVNYTEEEAELILLSIEKIAENFCTVDVREKIVYVCKKASVTVETLKQFVAKNLNCQLPSSSEHEIILEMYKALDIQI